MMRSRIPYGYRLSGGKAELHPEECRKLRLLYEYYMQGYSLKSCLQMAEVERSVGWLRSVFDNEIYKGTEYWPQVIPEELWYQAKKLAELRGKETAGKKKEALRQKPVPVESRFCMESPAEDMADADPVQYAARMYQSIRALGPEISEAVPKPEPESV